MYRWGGIVSTVVIIALVLGAIMFFSGSKKTPQDKTCLSYGGGIVEGSDYQRTVPPGTSRSFQGLLDKWYCYPTETERSYIITSRAGEGDSDFADSIVAPSADNIPMTFELAVYFRLDAEKLRDFHDSIGVKTDAFTDEGWRGMLAEYVRPQIDQSVQRLSRQYEAVDAYADSAAFREIQTNLVNELPDVILEGLGDDYFINFRVVLRTIGLPDGVVAELQRNQESEIAIETKENEIRQRQAEAEAIAALNQALERSGPAYVYLKCIEKEGCQLPSVAPFVDRINFGGG